MNKVLVSGIIILFSFCLPSCSSDYKISNDSLEDDLRKGLEWKPLNDSLYASSVLKIKSCRAIKETPISEEEFTLKFKAKVVATEQFFASHFLQGFYKKIPAWGEKKKELWLKIPPNKVLKSEGTITYVQTDTGWRVKGYEAPIIYQGKELLKFRHNKFKLPDHIKIGL